MNIASMQNAAQRYELKVDTAVAEHYSGFIAVIDQGIVSAVPYKKTYLAPTDADFFLMTCHWDLAVLFHRHHQKPVWVYEDTDDLRDICIPAHAGQKWAFILTKYNDPFDASSYAEHFSLERRVVSVLGGRSQDLMRMFFPDEWQREIDALWD